MAVPVNEASTASVLAELFDAAAVERCRPPRYRQEEWHARLLLAACYRVFDARNWTEGIFNHITLSVPGSENHFLINPFGLNYNEVTATNLVKIDLNGNPMEETAHAVNRAGFIIHAAIHAARADALCVIHTHSTAGVAVACKTGGLAMDNFYAALLYGRLAYHDFEGVTVNENEQGRIVADLGNQSCLVLRNHGLLVAESDLQTAYYWMYMLHRACEVQAASQAMSGANIPLSEQACAVSSRDARQTDPQGHLYRKVFAAAVRKANIKLEQLS
jgi:ribulose-5-phosphate 4-epimerase/fuculose-1-phosphate aldolase